VENQINKSFMSFDGEKYGYENFVNIALQGNAEISF